MLIGLVVLTLVDPSLVIVYSLVRISSLGLPNASLQFLDQVLKPNIGMLLMLWLKFHGFIPYCLSLAINYHLWLWFFVTMLVLFFLHLTRFRTCAQNILNWSSLCTWKSSCWVYLRYSCSSIPSICKYHDQGFTKYLILWISLQSERSILSHSDYMGWERC